MASSHFERGTLLSRAQQAFTVRCNVRLATQHWISAFSARRHWASRPIGHRLSLQWVKALKNEALTFRGGFEP